MDKESHAGAPADKAGPNFSEALQQHLPLFIEVARQLRLTYDVTCEQAESLTSELFRVLICMGYASDSIELSMPPKLDAAWHCALLNTAMYREFCEAKAGRFIEHSTVSDADADDVKLRRVCKLRELYVHKVWKAEPPSEEWWSLSGFNADVDEPTVCGEEADSEEEICVFVKTLTGSSTKLILRSTTTVLAVKRLLQTKMGTIVDHQRLLYAGKQLENTKRLRDYGVQSNEVIHLVLRLC
jgi:ubiquitin-large subunit ribosomal protein L40e